MRDRPIQTKASRVVTAREHMGWSIPTRRNRTCKGTELWNSMLCQGRRGPQAGGAVCGDVQQWRDIRLERAVRTEVVNQTCVPWEAEGQLRV